MGRLCDALQVTTLLSHAEEVSKAELPEPSQLETLRSNVAKQQQKVDQLSSSAQPAANGKAQVSINTLMHACRSVVQARKETLYLSWMKWA